MSPKCLQIENCIMINSAELVVNSVFTLVPWRRHLHQHIQIHPTPTPTPSPGCHWPRKVGEETLATISFTAPCSFNLIFSMPFINAIQGYHKWQGQWFYWETFLRIETLRNRFRCDKILWRCSNIRQDNSSSWFRKNIRAYPKKIKTSLQLTCLSFLKVLLNIML